MLKAHVLSPPIRLTHTCWACENIIRILKTQIHSHMHTKPMPINISTRRPNWSIGAPVNGRLIFCCVATKTSPVSSQVLKSLRLIQSHIHRQSGPGGCGCCCWNSKGITYRKPIIYLATRGVGVCVWLLVCVVYSAASGSSPAVKSVKSDCLLLLWL